MPGGGVEPDETAEEALARELEQKTGLKATGVPKLHGIFLNRSVSKHDHVLVYLSILEATHRSNQVALKLPKPAPLVFGNYHRT